MTGGELFSLCLPFTLTFPLWFFRCSKATYMRIDLVLNPQRESDFVVRERSKSRSPSLRLLTASRVGYFTAAIFWPVPFMASRSFSCETLFGSNLTLKSRFPATMSHSPIPSPRPSRAVLTALTQAPHGSRSVKAKFTVEVRLVSFSGVLPVAVGSGLFGVSAVPSQPSVRNRSAAHTSAAAVFMAYL